MEIPTHTGRAHLWMRTLGSPVLWVANAFLALLLWGDGIINTFPETYEYSRYLAPITDLHWHWKVIVILVVNIILFVELSFRTVGKRERQRDDYGDRSVTAPAERAVSPFPAVNIRIGCETHSGRLPRWPTPGREGR